MSLFDLTGKKGLIIGIANDQSIAYACAQAIVAQGAEIAIIPNPIIKALPNDEQ